jgi:anaerobic magnesium-protoporphyrin IX monomethyl ester cyclase
MATRVLLLNPRHTAIGSRIPGDHLPPLGLLAIGGPLIDSGFAVSLLDADREDLGIAATVEAAEKQTPDMVLIGHAGSTSAHPTVAELSLRLKEVLPLVAIIYGGVFPTYHWREVLEACPGIDVVVRGEGEVTARRVAEALRARAGLDGIPGIAWRRDGQAWSAPPATMIADLDAHRVGWELIEHARYTYWGGRRAVVVQFSRGCPHHCDYCGQRAFWTRWRHRDPVRFAAELARLHREHGVEVINFADELPTGSRPAWRAFLEALIAEHVPLVLVGSTRTGDVVRDADILHLYRRAGMVRLLLGIETYDPAVQRRISKGATPDIDREAIRLLRSHGIVSMATYVVGFVDEGDTAYWRSLRHLLSYDPDQIQLLYLTPHRWTPSFTGVADRKVVEEDQLRWDYKHQVLATGQVPAWRVFLWAKAIEVILQARPRTLWRIVMGGDREFRHAMRWYTRIGRRVWFHEVAEFLFRTRHAALPRRTVADFWGKPAETDEHAHARESAV